MTSITGPEGKSSSFDATFYLPRMGPALIPTSADHYPGGAETQVALLARGLVDRGWRIAVVIFAAPGGLPEYVDGIRIVSRRPYSELRRWQEPREMIATLRPLRSGVIVQRTASFETGTVGMASRLLNVPFVYSVASDNDFCFSHNNGPRKDRALFSLGIRCSSAIVTQTEAQSSLCRDSFGRTPTLIRSVVQPAGAPDAAEFLLWIGRLADHKRATRFIELAHRLPEARFKMIVTPDENSTTARQVLEAARITPNLVVAKSLPHDQVLAEIRRAVCVVVTSAVEGMPNVLLEGWASGIPALSFELDPLPGLERLGLGYVAHGSMETFTERAREMWIGQASNDRWRPACVSYVSSQHGVAAACDRWAELFERLRRGRDPRRVGNSHGSPDNSGARR